MNKMEMGMGAQKSPEEERAYREKVMEQRIQRAQEQLANVMKQMEYVEENTNYQSMSNGEFATFENNFAEVVSRVGIISGEFFNERNGIKVTHEDWEKYLNREGN